MRQALSDKSGPKSQKNAGTMRRGLHSANGGFVEQASVSEDSGSLKGAAPSGDAAKAGELTLR